MNKSANTPARRRALRGPVVVSAILAAALGLTACTGNGGDDPTGQSTLLPSSTMTSAVASPSVSGSGSASPSVAPSTVSNLDAISVGGNFGQAPAVTAKWPLAIAATQAKVLSEGTGAVVPKNGTVQVNYTGINARTGQSFDTSFKTGGKPVTFPLDQVITGFRTGLEGKKVGSRVLIMMTPKDGYAQGNPQAGILATDSLIFVVDIVQSQLTGPAGAAVTPAAGLPTVKDNGAGKAPTITIGSATKPSALVTQPLIKGTGPVVKETDTIVANYVGVAWNGTLLANNYTSGPEQAVLNTLITGWRKGLTGQTVGSRVLLVVPPSEGYPKGNSTPSYPAGETTVYVIDLLLATEGA
ncbi:FKBP-type peptidyl-prolyl cis-trans isomerase [Propionibacteriaceae bacterium G1746]|uniref:FKBP-type peptidyl-prolyl cis-trans isomerase n=1 Tax=Aestuariimicrobium sp. G57 TaxID=3418485 RepID=UPI003C180CAD